MLALVRSGLWYRRNCYGIENPAAGVTPRLRRKVRKDRKAYFQFPKHYPIHINISEQYAVPLVLVAKRETIPLTENRDPTVLERAVFAGIQLQVKGRFSKAV